MIKLSNPRRSSKLLRPINVETFTKRVLVLYEYTLLSLNIFEGGVNIDNIILYLLLYTIRHLYNIDIDKTIPRNSDERKGVGRYFEKKISQGRQFSPLPPPCAHTYVLVYV